MSAQPGYRIALVHTTDPHTRLRPGDEGTVTGYDPRLGQFSDRRVPFDSSELVFCVTDTSVTWTGCPGGSADKRLGPGGPSPARCPDPRNWPAIATASDRAGMSRTGRARGTPNLARFR